MMFDKKYYAKALLIANAKNPTNEVYKQYPEIARCFMCAACMVTDSEMMVGFVERQKIMLEHIEKIHIKDTSKIRAHIDELTGGHE